MTDQAKWFAYFIRQIASLRAEPGLATILSNLGEKISRGQVRPGEIRTALLAAEGAAVGLEQDYAWATRELAVAAIRNVSLRKELAEARRRLALQNGHQDVAQAQEGKLRRYDAFLAEVTSADSAYPDLGLLTSAH
jgi:hypothetical protein